MKLESVELKGFKSFKDKVNLQFNNPICAIVGPNGSGKSNISDAIRWVLGEQSAKSLRGNKMEDVIFSGTEKIAPLNFASVSLSFDNKEKWIPIEYEKVVVSRRVFRTGESQYYINKKACRLKDIRELFMDTGIGKEGYSIIGQGRIDEILSNKSEDRRYIFEEASGISKYKYKKEEALKKLDKTVTNLGRIEDVLIQKQENRDYLEKQAKRATIGLKLTEEIKLLDLYYYLVDVEIIQNKYNEIIQENKSIQEEIDSYKEIISKLEPSIEEESLNLKSLEDEIKRLSIEESSLKNKFQDYNLKLKLTEERVLNGNSEIDRISKEIEYFNEKLSKNKIRSKELDEERIETNDSLLYRKEELNDINFMLADLEEEIENLTTALSERESKLSSLKETLNNIQVENLTRERLFESRREDVLKLSKDKEGLAEELKVLNESYDKLNVTYNEINDKISEQLSSIEKLEHKIEDNKNKFLLLNEQYRKVEVDLSTKERELNFYINVRDNYEGYSKQVSNFFNRIKGTNLKNKCIGTLADLIEVEDKYLIAINNALGGSLQNVVVENEYDAKALIEFLKSERIGRLTFLPLNKINKPNANVKFDDERILAVASELVKCESKFKGLINHFLNKTLVVTNLEDAIEVSKKYNRYRIVTIDGEIFNSWGSIVGGYTGKSSNTDILNRNNKILELENENSILHQSKEKLIKELKDLDEILKNYNREYEVKKAEKNVNENEKIELEKKLQILSNDINVKKSLYEEAAGKYENILNASSEKLNLENHESISEEIQKLNREYIELKSNLEKINLDNRTLEIEKINITSKMDGLERDLNILSNKEKDIKNENEDFSHRLKLDIESKENVESELVINRENIKKYNDEINELDKELSEIESILKENEAKFKVRQDELLEKKEELKDYKDINVKLDYSMGLNLEKIENLNSNISRIRSNCLEEYSVYIDKFTLIEEVEEPTRSKLKSLKKDLRNLGYFSVDTIEEFKIVDEDLNFLLNQKNDLLKSKNDIEEIIKNLNKEMKEMFTTSFKDINNRFQKIFRILFDGGNAELKLEGSNPLESGVEIVAEPPGKKLQNLTLLSGGEKSLTAVALLFAIFETRPSPFCILDEIDAALDEANITRYTSYLKSLTDQTQFIMISHRKTTMEIADVLYGVSMEEEGVSKVVSLKLK
ncbi:chromosome segregation protein SMC [Mediannikoviicoccus vaginalis]|uniref:chromosome segregation protein SMC n=1 Tax=Mediannikoviicoccus vaginalis TaxID=2899727 RepID=UPI001EFF80E7|nr:chromosome segregation protein SMC [Mediannikoviicoccus vaginalis]